MRRRVNSGALGRTKPGLMRVAFASAFIVVGVANALGAQHVVPTAPADTVGCYLATPHLTYSAFGEPERGDNAWSILRLERNGSAKRPLLRPWYDRNSRWGYRSDSLVVVVHDGLVGWLLTLIPADSGWRGNARYLTDVMGGEQINRRIDLRRRTCEGLPNEELNLTGAFRWRLARTAREPHFVKSAGRLTPAR